MLISKNSIKIFYITITLFFSVIAVSAQNADFNWSDIKNNTKVGLQNPTYVFPTESGFTTYSVESSGSQYYAPKEVHITNFTALGEIKKTINFKLPKRLNKDATLLKVLQSKDKLYFFSNIAVKKDKKNVLYAQVYDNETGVISEAKEIYSLPIEKVNNSGFYKVVSSQDNNTIAVLVNDVYIKKTKEKIILLKLDSNLELVSQTKHTLSFNSERAYKEQLFVENNGTITIIKKTNILKKEPITSILTINDDTLVKQQVSSKGFYISSAKVLNINNENYLLGFATDNAKPVASIGGTKEKSFFIYNITQQELIKNESWSPEILKKVLGKGFINLKVKTILVEKEDIYLIGDCFSEKSEVIEGKNFEYNYTYNFGSGVVIKLNTKGQVFYQSHIKYYESYKNKEKILGSFYPYIDEGKLKILANEKESRLKKKAIVGGKAIYAKAIVLKTFNKQGEITVTPFWNSKIGGKNDLVYYAPTNTIKLNNNVFYIYAMGRKYHRFGKMTIK